MLKLYLAVLITLPALATAQQPHSRKLSTGSIDRTGICARKLDWFDERHRLVHHLEVIIYRQSAHVAADVRRKAFYERNVLRPYLPHMKPYTWLGAWVSDTTADQVHGPDCLNLPRAFER